MGHLSLVGTAATYFADNTKIFDFRLQWL